MLKFPEATDPGLALQMQRCSTVMVYPPRDKCTLIADLMLEQAYERRWIGISYGLSPGLNRLEFRLSATPQKPVLGAAAPTELAAASDATFSRVDGSNEASRKDIFGYQITLGGGAVAVVVKKIDVVCECSADTEGVAMVKAGQRLVVAREIFKALGGSAESVPLLATDGESARLIITGEGNANRSRPSLRRYCVLGQRVREGELAPIFVTDEENTVDYLTKWLPISKLRESLRFATGHYIWDVNADGASP